MWQHLSQRMTDKNVWQPQSKIIKKPDNIRINTIGGNVLKQNVESSRWPAWSAEHFRLFYCQTILSQKHLKYKTFLWNNTKKALFNTERKGIVWQRKGLKKSFPKSRGSLQTCRKSRRIWRASYRWQRMRRRWNLLRKTKFLWNV